MKTTRSTTLSEQKYKGVSNMTKRMPHCAKLHRIDVILISSCVKDFKGITPMESQCPTETEG